MFFSDSLANTVSAINVGYLSKHKFIKIPVNNYMLKILQKLIDVGAIESIKLDSINDAKRQCIITLAYVNGKPAITYLKIISKKSNRYYAKLTFLKKIQVYQKSVIILSTSHGILTNSECCKHCIGGEAIIWVHF